MKYLITLWLLAVVSFQVNATQISIITNLGNIDVELYDEKAPKTVKNFLDYIDSSFYDGTIFHRVISGFMAQGGGFTIDMERKKNQITYPL